MAKIICSLNKKGGSGKTSSVGTFASIVGMLGKKVLLVDMDPQCNLTSLYGIGDRTNTIATLFMKMSNELTYETVVKSIQITDYNNVDIIAGDENLDETIDLIAVDMRRVPQMILKNILKHVDSEYDYIFIDNTPYFNLLVRNSLCAASEVIIPVECDKFSYDGLRQLLKKVYEIRTELNPSLIVKGVFLTKVDQRTNLAKILYNDYINELGSTFMKTVIRQDNSIKESNTEYKPLPYWKKKSAALLDYMRLLRELSFLDLEENKLLDGMIDKAIVKKTKEENESGEA